MYILKAAMVQAGVVAWGSNATGQRTVPSGLSNVVAVAAGTYDSMALLRNGTVVVWGGTNTCPLTVPPDLTNAVAIAAGPFHNLALRTDGTVTGWGCGDWGQLNIPAGLSNVTSIAAGYYHSLAARKDGTVVAWGNGPLAFPADLTNAVAVAGGYQFGLALRTDGTVASAEIPFSQVGPLPAGISNVISIAAGHSHCLALKRDGTAIAWGKNTSGQVNVPTDLSNVVAIAAGLYHNLALRSDGTVVAWGADDSGQIQIPGGLTNVGFISGGQNHSLALTREGAPFFVAQPPPNFTTFVGRPVFFNTTVAGAVPLTLQWKSNATNVPSATNSLFYLAACKVSDSGSYLLSATNAFGTAESAKANLQVIDSAPSIHTPLMNTSAYPGKQLKLRFEVDGSWPLSYQWFFNSVPVPGATASDLSFNAVSPTDTGLYTVTASNSFGVISNSATLLVPPVLIMPGELYSPPGVTDVVAIATTDFGPGALMRNGTVAAWNHDTGQLYVAPTAVTNVVTLAGDQQQFIAVRRDGSVIEWYPDGGWVTLHPEVTNAVGVAGGSISRFVVKADGTVNAYGSFYPYGTGYPVPATVPAGLSNVVAVAAGTAHALALHADGTVTGWGQVSIPPGLSNVVAVTASLNASAALKSDGTVVAWGAPSATGISNAVAIVLVNNSVGIALADRGVIADWGGSSLLPSSLTNVTAMAARNWGITKILALAAQAAPFFTALPSTRVLNAGRDAVIAAQVTGTLPLNYQWRLNGANLPDATNRVLTLANAQSANAGSYSLVAGNSIGMATGAVANVIVSPALTVIQQPSDQTVMRGSTAIFSVGVRGSVPFSYQWKFNGTNLASATNSSLILTNVQASDNGPYSVAVTNAYGGLVSSNATLAVIIPLAGSVNTTGLVWTTSGGAPWFGQAFVTHDGIDAAQSGHITDNQQSVLQTTMVGPGSINFWWRVSSEQFYDILKFSINGAEAARISGEVNWQQQSFPVSGGVQTLTWVYSKDSSTSGGQDAGWLDQVTYTGGGSPPFLVQPSVNNGSFSASLQTFTDKTYVLEFKNSLLDSNWTSLPAIIGDGTAQTFIDTNAPVSQRFYRVRITP